mmetsp:Transcript_89036/g.154199  ORF Transcript_89036/g.154199 Transcript_89036/m.154199 type:complete len:81 (-) Transcript_89036:211-453(-)
MGQLQSLSDISKIVASSTLNQLHARLTCYIKCLDILPKTSRCVFVQWTIKAVRPITKVAEAVVDGYAIALAIYFCRADVN